MLTFAVAITDALSTPYYLTSTLIAKTYTVVSVVTASSQNCSNKSEIVPSLSELYSRA